MLSKKIGIKYSLSHEYAKKLRKLKIILKREKDSEITRYIVEKYIDEYEEENGDLEE